MIEIIRKEILENVTTYRFGVLTTLLALLMAVSMLVSYGDYHLRTENYNILRPTADEPEKIILPPEPLSMFAKGLDANLGRLYQLSALGVEVQSNQQSINRLFSLFTVPDMLFVIRVILALIAILFSFDTLCGEKENGTLKLLLSGGATRSSVVLGKLAGRFLLVFIPFGLLFLLSGVVAALMPDVSAGADYWTRMAFMLLASGLYVVTFLAIGMLISSLIHRSAAAMAAGLAVWVLLVFVVPEMGATAAQSARGVPPADRVEMQNRLAAVRSIYEALQASKTGQRDFSRITTEIREANSQVFESYRPRLNALLDLTKSFVRVSPSGAFLFLMTETANTGLSTDLRLKDEMWRYIGRNFRRLAKVENAPPDHFVLPKPALPEQLAGPALPDLLLLLILPALFIAATMGAFMRYDPR